MQNLSQNVFWQQSIWGSPDPYFVHLSVITGNWKDIFLSDLLNILLKGTVGEESRNLLFILLEGFKVGEPVQIVNENPIYARFSQQGSGLTEQSLHKVTPNWN